MLTVVAAAAIAVAARLAIKRTSRVVVVVVWGIFNNRTTHSRGNRELLAIRRILCLINKYYPLRYIKHNMVFVDQADHDGSMPPYFRFLTIMALSVFVQEKVDVAILEVGIGGLYDCTNIIR